MGVGNRDNGSALLRFSGLSRAQHLKQAQINHQMIRYFHTFNLSSETSKASHSLTHCVTHLHQPPSDDAGTQDPPSTSPSPQPDPPASQHLCQQFHTTPPAKALLSPTATLTETDRAVLTAGLPVTDGTIFHLSTNH